LIATKDLILFLGSLALLSVPVAAQSPGAPAIDKTATQTAAASPSPTSTIGTGKHVVVVPPEKAKPGGIDIVDTGALHTDLSDRGPQSVKEKIQETLDRFLKDSDASDLAPANTEQPMIANPGDY